MTGTNRKARRAIRAQKAGSPVPQVDAIIALAVQHYNAGQFAEAAACFERVVAARPDLADMHHNLGCVRLQQGRLTDAIACFERVLALKPSAEAHNLIGAALVRQGGRIDEAMTHYRHALALDPHFVEAQNNIANLLAAAGQLEEAAEMYRRVVDTRPDFVEARENLARTFLTRGDAASAMAILVPAFRVRATPSMKGLFAQCLRYLQAVPGDPEFSAHVNSIRGLVVSALWEPWGRPSELATAAAAIVGTNADIAGCIARANEAWPSLLSAQELFGASGLAALASDQLLQILLQSTRITDIALERMLTSARHALLGLATAPEPQAVDKNGLEFFKALATQCFINEYVFSLSDDERVAANRLRQSLESALQSGEPADPLAVVAVAAYVPLHELPNASSLLACTWPAEIAGLLAQQLQAPLEEQRLRAQIPKLTPIEDEISQQVRAQYEENPYPRWVKASPAVPRASIEEYVRDRFPRAAFQSVGRSGDLDILVAGCGSGQHAILIARRYPRARILAIDLSLASLAYAWRKTRELGVANIEYAQADILALGSMGRSFDLVEASGVLHHLADPFAGWRVLLSLLRPGGFMSLGLYSELGRQSIVAARALIADRGYRSTADDIRRCRQELIDMPEGTSLRRVAERGDFFATSECRDLLFHVQEHRLSLPQIASFLAENGLQFLGFDLEPASLRRYAQRFPEDRTMTDLARWHIFEKENPDTFANMYQFSLQRPPAA
jgi:tetratricopeptide (TPR) repeat protein